MASTLAAILEENDDPVVSVCCASCGRLIGRYVVYLHDDDPGSINLIDPGIAADGIPGRGVSRMTGARAYEVVALYGRRVKFRWRCGCGARPLWRADRLGRLEVDERSDPARVYV